MTKILLTGGSGYIGQKLCEKLHEQGYEVGILSRSKNKNPMEYTKTYYWDIDRNIIDKEAVNSADYIIHLAGANIGAKKWTRERKQQILNSRVDSGKIIFDSLNENNTNLKAFISASAIAYYGSKTTDIIYDESFPNATDFLGDTCLQWETIAEKFATKGIRNVQLRTGIVLSKNEGVWPKLYTPVKYGLGSALGSGKQYFPWIQIDDLINIYLKAITDENIKGPYNAVSPQHITNEELIKKIASYYKKPLWLPKIPSSLIKLFLGEMSSVILEGSRICSQKIENAGFIFKYPNLNAFLKSKT